jgi:hypothetical protein
VLIRKNLSWCLILTAGLSPLTASAFAGAAHKFTVSEPTEIPGMTLRPGSYTIHVVDHLSERYVVRVDGLKGRVHSTFLALENPEVPKPATPSGPILQGLRNIFEGGCFAMSRRCWSSCSRKMKR